MSSDTSKTNKLEVIQNNAADWVWNDGIWWENGHKLERDNTSLRKQAEIDLKKCITAKNKHQNGYCEAKSGYTCGACHFYSGAIQALTKVLGKEAQP